MNELLKGKRILVTRPAAQAGTLAQAIAAQGGEPVLFPLLEISPVDDPLPMQQAIARLDAYALAVFISPNAFESVWPLIKAQGGWPAGLVAAAIGQSTATLLHAVGIARVIVPTGRFDSEALLALPEFSEAQVAGQRILILRGNGGRELLADTLRERGAQVDGVACYQRSAPGDPAQLLSWLHHSQLDGVTVSSSEGLRNLFDLLDTECCERLRGLPVFVPHPRIAEVAAGLGLTNIVQTGPADAGIVSGLCAYPWPKNG